MISRTTSIIRAARARFAFARKLRELLDQYGAIFTVAEISGDDTHEFQHRMTAGEEKLSSAYGFDFLYADKLTPQVVCDALARWPGGDAEGWADMGVRKP